MEVIVIWCEGRFQDSTQDRIDEMTAPECAVTKYENTFLILIQHYLVSVKGTYDCDLMKAAAGTAKQRIH